MGFLGNSLGLISPFGFIADAAKDPSKAGNLINPVMSGIGQGLNVLGGGGGSGGSLDPRYASLISPNLSGVGPAMDRTNQGLDQQQAFVNALNAQNGIQNQSNVFNQLQGVANGTGPNPAQAALNQATGQNVAGQAALMAGQRGAGANAGLIARQAGQQGAATQQQAAGQSATLQAQQQLGALGQLGGIANAQVGQQQNALLGYNQLAQGNQNSLFNAVNGQNSAALTNEQIMTDANTKRALANQGILSKLLGGGLNALGSVGSLLGGGAGAAGSGAASGASIGADIGTAFLSKGGEVKEAGPRSYAAQFLKGCMAEGGMVDPYKQFGALAAPPQPLPMPNPDEAKKLGKSIGNYAKGGRVPAMLSPGEIYLSPDKAKKVAQGKESPTAGKRIPGKAQSAGDTLKNDIVPMTLEEGGVVIPRTVAHGDPAKMVEFVQRITAQSSLKKRRM